MKNFLIPVLALCLFSCNENRPTPTADYFFAEPQPVNDSELSEIPSKFLGKYQSQDSSFLTIDKKIIFLERFTKFRIAKNELDSLKKGYDFKNGKLIGKIEKESYDVVNKGDSLELASIDIDTIFTFADKAKAKRVNGNLVLSRKDSVLWKSEWLKLDKDVLTTNLIYQEKDLMRIDSLSRVKSANLDANKFLLTLSKREFIKMMELKKLGSERTFKKIKRNT